MNTIVYIDERDTHGFLNGDLEGLPRRDGLTRGRHGNVRALSERSGSERAQDEERLHYDEYT